MLIDLVQLRTFVAVAEEQHLTHAAERLHISQSAASAQLRAVEDKLNLQLFIRTNRRLELTRAGQLLLSKAKTLLNEASVFNSFARELCGKIEGELVIGASSDPAISRIGEMISSLRTKHPLIRVNLRTRQSLGSRQGLKSGELDIVVLLGQPSDTGVTYYELKKVRFSVVGPIAWKEQIENANWAELSRLPWITPNDSSAAYKAMLGQLFGSLGLELNSVARFDNATHSRMMLEAGVGLTLMREEYAILGSKKGTLSVSPIADTQLQLFMAHLASRRNDPLIEAFLGAATDVWPELCATTNNIPA
jgi:DNA-binding transcriptional LysR family regulator